jgi:hypothetical protein
MISEVFDALTSTFIAVVVIVAGALWMFFRYSEDPRLPPMAPATIFQNATLRGNARMQHFMNVRVLMIWRISFMLPLFHLRN